MWLILQVLGEELLAISKMMLTGAGLGRERRFYAFRMSHFQCSIHLIGTDMVEALAFVLFWQALPVCFGSLKQRERSHHIGLRKSKRIFDAAVNMTLCCKVDDAIYLLILHEFEDTVEIANIHLHELVVRLILNILEVRKITCIRQLIQVDNLIVWIFVHKQPYNMASDKSGSTGYYDSFHSVILRVSFIV